MHALRLLETWISGVLLHDPRQRRKEPYVRNSWNMHRCDLQRRTYWDFCVKFPDKMHYIAVRFSKASDTLLNHHHCALVLKGVWGTQARRKKRARPKWFEGHGFLCHLRSKGNLESMHVPQNLIIIGSYWNQCKVNSNILGIEVGSTLLLDGQMLSNFADFAFPKL